MSECVKVLVRCRPMNQRETSLTCKSILNIESGRAQCSIVNPNEQNGPPKTFTFDAAYSMDSTTDQIYTEIVYPLVENVLEGFNGTVFAYGQTGSGKSFSMQGPEGVAAQKGIIPRVFEHLFEATSITTDAKYLICVSFLEIYNEEVRDLLGKDIKQKLDIKEHPERGVYVAGLSMHAVHSVKECEAVMQKGLRNRATGATLMNADSSRSHSIFTVYLEMMECRDDEEHIKTAKLHLVDLAGSERQTKTGATGERLKEATKINLSLSALGNVISALVDGKAKHIPYRDSRLTRLLQDSLGGNTKTIMVACLSPADNNYDETLSTLRYANRAKNIRNKPRINEDPKDALLREYQEEIKRLKALLGGADSGTAPMNQEAIDEEKRQLREEYQAQVEALKQQYEEEQSSKSLLQQELKKLKEHYEQSVSKLQPGSNNNNNDHTGHSKKQPLVPSSSPTGTVPVGSEAQETLKRLQMLQEQMVGGEQANNEALKEKRRRKQTESEKQRQKLAEALSRVDGDDPLLQVYHNTQEKLDALAKQLEKERKRNKAMENDINDLQSEFELDRIDYLDTIRRQDQQIKLLQQVLDKVQPCLRRDSNYSNLEKVRKEAVWDEDLQKWHLPEVAIIKTQLPNASGVMPGGRVLNNGESVSPQHINGYGHMLEEEEHDKLKMKLEQSSVENLAANYFKSSRPLNIMAKTEMDKHRNLENNSSCFPSHRSTWENLLNGVVYTDDIYERESWHDSQSNNGSLGGKNGLNHALMAKKPPRLESLQSSQAANPPAAANRRSNLSAISSAKRARNKKLNDIIIYAP